MTFKQCAFILMLCMIGVSCGPKKYYAVVDTEYGSMKFELYDSTPLHRDNFVKLAKEGFYEDLLFHRVIQGFMIQGGDPDSKGAPQGARLGQGGPGYTIPAEIGAPHFKGTLAAARTSDAMNPQRASSGSQFYIVHGTAQSQASLRSIGAQKKIEYSEAHIAKYEQVGGTPMLDMDYTVFGEIVSGMEVIDKIAAVSKDQSDRPLEDVKMSVRITTN